MLHPRNATANAVARELVWAAVCDSPDVPVVQAVATKASEFRAAGSLNDDEVQALYGAVGCLDTTTFAKTGRLDSIVEQLGWSLSGLCDAFPLSELERLLAVLQGVLAETAVSRPDVGPES